MRIALLLLWLFWAPVAAAQTVAVTSGEHEGFTRLVLNFARPVDWRIFRTDGGYGLTIPGPSPRYDLSDVWRLIPRDRLSALFADQGTGALQLGIGCDCHALPFELRPGIVVVDIRDGPAPEGSSFELTSDGQQSEPLRVKASQRPEPRPGIVPVPPPAPQTLDWRNDLVTAARKGQHALQDLPPAVANPDLGAMRDALLWQLGRGAAKGVVDMTSPSAPSQTRPVAPASSHLNMAGAPGFDANAAEREPNLLTGSGQACLPDDQLDLVQWAGPESAASQMGAIRSALLGEFDRPDPAGIERAVTFYLHLGFGSEARQLLQQLEITSGKRTLWESMAHVLDGEIPPESAFTGMEVCDTFAALWAVLSLPALPESQATNRPAVNRAFSALPLHLRRHLGPALADRFMAAGDQESARTIRDAILRAPGEPGAEVRLLAAQIELASNPNLPAAPTLTPLTKEPGPVGIDATVDLTLREAKAGGVVDPAQTTALAAHLHEQKGGPGEGDLRDALAIGLATQGAYAEAFGLGSLSPEANETVWQHMGASAPDSQIILHAIREPETALPDIQPKTRQTLAKRLITLGFAGQALRWLNPDDAGSDPELARLVAEARMMDGDAQAALNALAGMTGAEAELIRAAALEQLNDSAAIGSYGRSGDKDQQDQSARRLQAWDEVATVSADPVWTQAARLLAGANPDLPTDAGTTAPPPDAPGPSLAATRELLADSAQTRSTLEALLRQSALPPAAE